MKTPLGIAAPILGARSETFIQRHMCDLLPGQTAVISSLTGGNKGPPAWKVDGPLLDLSSGFIGSNKTPLRMARALARTLGLKPDLALATRFLRKYGVQALMGEYLFFSEHWLDLARRIGIRFVAHAHGLDVSSFLRNPSWRRRYLHFNQADCVVTVNQPSRERLIQLGIASEKIEVIPCGVHVPDRPTPHNERNEIRCLAVGRMVTKKGPIMTLDAFRRASSAVPSLRLDYVGDGPLMPAVRQFTGTMDLHSRVALHGGLPNERVQDLMREADIFVQHSILDSETGDAEGLPVAVLEAMAAALPVVATTHEGIPEAIPDDSVGLLVAEGDTVGMAERIVALARDLDSRQKIGLAAWSRARDHFSWEKERRRLLNVLRLGHESSPLVPSPTMPT